MGTGPRQTLIVIHRWTALAVGIVLLCTALGGASLVFEGAIDRGLHPELWRVDPSGSTLPIDSLVARVEARHPGTKVLSVGVSDVPDRAWTMAAGGLTFFVNPHTGSITGERTPAESQATLARRLHVFHVELFAGRVGRSIVGAMADVALFLVVTGIILWWPDKLVRIHTRASWKRINFDLHHAVGIVAAAILIVMTSSAMVIHYAALTKAMKSLDRSPEAPTPKQVPGPANSAPPSFDASATAARNALPGAAITSISTGGPKNPVTVAMRFPEDRTPGGRSRVYLDRYTGRVLAAVSTRDAELGTRLDNLKRSLHTGDVLGKPTEALWFLATLALAAQFVSGVLMWWNGRRARRRVDVGGARE